jgi:hypothetical protein
MTETGDRAISLSLIGANRAVQAHLVIAGSEGGQYPQVLNTGPGRAVVAWVGKGGSRREIRLALIRFEAGTTGSSVALKE